MTVRRLRLVVDAEVLFSYVQGCLERADWRHEGRDRFPEDPQDACRLLVLLGSIHEFELMTVASELTELMRLLQGMSVDRQHAEVVMGKLLEVVSVVPQEAVHVEQAMGSDAQVGDFRLRLLLACARSASAHGVVAMWAFGGDAGEGFALKEQGVMTPCEFFAMLRERYGLDYGEIVSF